MLRSGVRRTLGWAASGFLSFVFAALLATGALAGPTVSVSVPGARACIETGLGTWMYAGACYSAGMSAVSFDAAAPPPLEILRVSGTASRDEASVWGDWTASMTLSDQATGDSMTFPLTGYYSCDAFNWGASVFANLTSTTVALGADRYTLTDQALKPGSLPWEASLVARLTYHPPTDPGLSFTTQPGSTDAGQPLSPQPVVALTRPDGSVATDFTGRVTLRIQPGTGRAGAMLLGTTTVNAVAGVAQFTNISIDKPGPGYVLLAGSGTEAGTASAPFNANLAPGVTPTVSFRTESIAGDATETFDSVQVDHGIVQTTGTSILASSAGAGFTLFNMGFSVRSEGCSFNGCVEGAWRGRLHLTDDESGETVTAEVPGSYRVCVNPSEPSSAQTDGSANVHPTTVTAGGRRYTITGSSDSQPMPWAVIVTMRGAILYNPPTQSAPVFATQPGGSSGSLTLDRQPVVVYRKADGSVDTHINGDVHLILKPGTYPHGTVFMPSRTRSVTARAVQGVATFQNLALNQVAGGVVVTAYIPGYPVADSQTFNVGTDVSMADAIRALRVAGGLEPQAQTAPASLNAALSLARKAAGL